jgi:phosphoribosylglycinamide formyltransferase-1
VPARVVVLVSGSGTLLQSLLDCASPLLEIVAVGSDRPDIEGLARAQARGIATFTVEVGDFADRDAWNEALREAVRSHNPDWVLSAGFMRILSPEFLEAFPNRVINTHPALLPAFPGAQAVRDALAYGAKVTGATMHLVDEGTDTGPVLAQQAVEVKDGDTEESLHERIKVAERTMVVDVMQKLAEHGCTVVGRKVSIP